MKKRRMKLMALLLTLAVTFTSVVPAGATALGTEGDSGIGIETTVPEDSGAADKEDADKGDVTDETIPDADGTGNTAGDTQNNQGTESTADADQTTASKEEVQDANYTVEEVTDAASGETTQIIFRCYEDAAAKTGLLAKWVYDAATASWTYYLSDDAAAAPETLVESTYKVGVMKIDGTDGEADTYLDLVYWLGADGKGKSGWLAALNLEDFSYFYVGNEEELIGDAAEEEKAELSKFYAGLRKPSEAITSGYYPDINGDSYWLEDLGVIAKATWKPYKDDKGVDYYLYFGDDGKQDKSKKGLQTIDGTKYFLKDDLSLLKNDSVMIDGRKYVFDENGKYVKDYKPVKAGWEKNKNGWWYQNEDGSYPENCWQEINGSKFYFGKYGYMQTDWLRLDGKWYYLGGKNDGSLKYYWQKIGKTWYYLTPGTGVMAEGWQKIWGLWYYLKPGSGAMAEGWLKTGTKWFYMKPGSGAMVEGWLKTGNKWFYMRPGTGTMAEGWLKTGTKWFYLRPGTGTMAEGWQKIGKSWYYLRPGTGTMAEGWQKIGKSWYYLTPGSGNMKTGWYKINSTWYYSYSSGVMAANTWVGDYYLTGSGAMATSRWVGSKYVDKNGKYIPGYGTVNVNTLGNWEQKNGKWYFLKENGEYAKDEKIASGKKWYYLDNNGVMVTGWRYVNGYKLFFNSSGALIQDVSDKVSGPYKVRVNRTTCVITIFAKDGGNGWTIPVKSMTCSVGLPATPTPVGTFYIGDQDRWHILMGPSWGQYTSHVVNGIFIHSVAGVSKSIYNLSSADYNNLGRPASHGCIRLCVRDAKWIYTNCSRGTQVQIGDGFTEPFDKPATIKLPTGNGLKDPTQC